MAKPGGIEYRALAGRTSRYLRSALAPRVALPVVAACALSPSSAVWPFGLYRRPCGGTTGRALKGCERSGANANNKQARIIDLPAGDRQGLPPGGQPLQILKDVCLDIFPGESCAIVGASGSGKSTLLNILGLLDRPDSGAYRFAEHDIFSVDGDRLAAIRNRLIGFVFQSFNLLPRLNALDNVALPLSYRGMPRREALERAEAMLARVGLAERAGHRPADLSGGQRQRVAIARALVGEPALILADEPTGNLDASTAKEVLELLLTLNRERQVTLVVVTHDPSLAARLGRQLTVRHGEVHEDLAEACR
ncbi:ABC transporter ATP-binding protein [Pseudomonas aeruginosa]|nr:ABC transporter ATP-binding protein [Pseudomonas aeruginosa]